MPIQKKWSKLTEANLKKLGNTKGAYEVADRNKKTLDIGKGDSITSDVAKRIRAKKKKYPAIQHFRVEPRSFFETGEDIEARHSSAYRAKHSRRPSKNKRSPRKTRGIFGM